MSARVDNLALFFATIYNYNISFEKLCAENCITS